MKDIIPSRAHCAQMQRVNQSLIVPLPRTIFIVASSDFFTHDIFRFDARAVKRIRGCVADSILDDLYKVLCKSDVCPFCALVSSPLNF